MKNVSLIVKSFLIWNLCCKMMGIIRIILLGFTVCVTILVSTSKSSLTENVKFVSNILIYFTRFTETSSSSNLIC